MYKRQHAHTAHQLTDPRTHAHQSGAWLTAHELVYEQIPSTLVADGKASFLMARQGISDARTLAHIHTATLNAHTRTHARTVRTPTLKTPAHINCHAHACTNLATGARLTAYELVYEQIPSTPIYSLLLLSHSQTRTSTEPFTRALTHTKQGRG